MSKASLLSLALLIMGCTRGATKTVNPRHLGAGDHALTVRVGEQERRYLVHVPDSYAPEAGAVIMFHGGGGTAGGAMRDTRWDKASDQHGFLAVFPEGTAPNPEKPGRFATNPQTWNDGSGRSNLTAVSRDADDLRFAEALMDDLVRRFGVDEGRVFVTGFSNGASMTFRIGRELSHRVAAIAPVAGHDWMDEPEPEPPISLLYITGDVDPLNPLEGGEIRLGDESMGVKGPVVKMISRWAAMQECDAVPSVEDLGTGIRRSSYARCANSTEVQLYVVQGLGHNWPGGNAVLPERLVGPSSNALIATEVIWEFFARQFRE